MPSRTRGLVDDNSNKVRRKKLAFVVSFPIPVFAPVTMMTWPDKSGISLTLKCDLEMKKLCLPRDNATPMVEDMRKTELLSSIYMTIETQGPSRGDCVWLPTSQSLRSRVGRLVTNLVSRGVDKCCHKFARNFCNAVRMVTSPSRNFCPTIAKSTRI
jgi:hypothetical protein